MLGGDTSGGTSAYSGKTVLMTLKFMLKIVSLLLKLILRGDRYSKTNLSRRRRTRPRVVGIM
jgi:hypothetical protein